jgi:hypothetical protein
MAKEISLVELQTMTKLAGLNLSEQELEKLLPGVNRSHKQAWELRELITDSIEPASTFVPCRTQKS